MSRFYGFLALPVTFKRELQNEVSKGGGAAMFSCELSKPGAPVDWRKGRIILKSGEKYEIKQDGKIATLFIHNIEESDAGYYSCKTKDSESTAELTVQGKERWFLSGGRNLSSTADVLWLLFCLLWRSAYKSAYKFAFCALRLCMALDYNAGRQSLLKLLFCLSPWLLFPVPPITFKVKLKNQDVEEENDVRLRCELSKAGVFVQWRKGEEQLKSGPKYQITHQDTTLELIIKTAMPEESGVYSCICGDQSTKANINVFGRMRSS